ncbi:MAG: radical SAM peptide maturase [Bacteroidota bacterium]
MKKPVFFTTHNGNSYCYSPFCNQLSLCHPLLRYFFELDSAGTDLKIHTGSFRKTQRPLVLDKISYPSREVDYQLKKYLFLKRNRLFKIPKEISLNGKLLPSRVAGDLSRIQQVIFETTEECNLSCTYCTYSKFYVNKARGKKKFDPANAKKALEYLLSIRDASSTHLIISFYGGEPLKNISFIREIVSFVQENFSETQTFKFNLTTNGLLLSKHADFLSANDFDVSVSLDGDENNNAFRLLSDTLPSHAMVVKNLDFVRSRYPAFFERNLSIMAVLHNRNSFSEVHEYFRSRFGKVPLTSVISTSNITEENRVEFSNTFLDGMQNDFQESAAMLELFLAHPTVKELANAIEKYTGIVFKNHLQIISAGHANEGTREFVPTATCLPFSMRVFLSADGAILPCEHIGRNFEIGRLENGQVQINPETVSAMFNRNFAKIRSLCNQCFLADNCKECVFNTGVETDNPRCDFFLDEDKFKKTLSNIFSLIEKNMPLYHKLLKEGYHG